MVTIYSAQGTFTGHVRDITTRSIKIDVVSRDHSFTLTFERSKVRVVWPQAVNVRMAA